MVQVRYHIIVYTKDNIPTRIVYTYNRAVVGEKVADGNFGGEDLPNRREYYVEHDSLGLFLYVDKTKNKIIKKETYVQDFKLVDKATGDATNYKPKTTIKYVIDTA